jgi:probable phosphoglycerate mutase
VIELWLVRHAEPEWEPGGRAVDEPALSELGRAQAEAVAGVLEGEAFDGFFVSPLPRALETAGPIARRLGAEPRTLGWLAELRLPSLEGRTPEEVEAFFRESRARDLEKQWDGIGTGGESFRHFYERVSAGVESLLTLEHRAELHENSGYRIWRVSERAERLLLVAHSGTNAVILSHLLGVDPVPWAFLRFESAHTGIARIRTVPVATGSIWRLEDFNRLTHLDPGDITR